MGVVAIVSGLVVLGAILWEAFETVILPRLRDFRPDILIISAGFDAHTRDPLANLNLVEADFTWVTKKLMEVADLIVYLLSDSAGFITGADFPIDGGLTAK